MSLDVFQQVFFLSLTSNAVSNLKGTQSSLQRMLQLALQNLLPRVGAGWELAWGPVVWKNKPDEAATGPDNSWYIAYHPALEFEDGSVHPTYVIAVAGTPPESSYVWIHENFAVNSVVDFNAWVSGGIQNRPQVVPPAQVVPGNPYIAKGTANGTYLLLNTAAPEGAAAPGATLPDFLSGVGGDSRFITTGHSLGGALCPSLALALVTSGVLPAESTLTYPSAGPSPGNRGFTELFTVVFPARKTGSSKSYQGWNLNLVNTLDIVPQAWSVQRQLSPKQNLHNIPPIYGKPVIPFVRGVTFLFSIHTLASGALYFPLPSQYITGPPPSSVPTTVEEFLRTAVPQHGTVYYEEVGITLPELNKSEVLGRGLNEKTTDETRFNYPVIAGLEWAREHPEETKKQIEGLEGTDEGKALLIEAEAD